MVNILKNPQRRPNLGRNGHDLSFRRTFSHSCGQLLPVMWDFLSPNETVRINDNLFTRTQPLATPAFIRATEHIYYFFVPMCQIDPYFDNAFYGIKDFVNTNDLDFSGRGTNKETPIVSQSILISNIKTGIFNNFLSGDAIGNDGYYVYNDNGTQYLCLASGVSPVDNSFYGVIGLDEYGIPTLWNVMRLLDMLDYGVDLFQHVLSGDPASSTNPQSCNFSIDVHRLQAYQKIWFDYFRNSTYSPNNPWAYNCGYAMKGSGTNGWQYDYSTLYNTNYNGLFKLRYHPLKKDFFTCIQPTPLFDVNDDVTGYNSTAPEGGLNSYVLSSYGVQLQSGSISQSIFRNSNIGVGVPGYKSGTISRDIGIKDFPATGDMYVTSLQQLRLMYAYDKLLQITQRAGKHVDDQTEAHFGVRPPKGMAGEVIYLGSHSSRLNIGEIAATAAGSNGSTNTMESTSSLGELAGRGLGVSSRNRTIKYKTNCHGYLMAVYSLVPDIDYLSTGTDRRSLWRSIMDYPRPEFDNLGMQPLYRFQLMNTFYADDSVITVARADTIIGWQYRWMEEKLSYDRVNGGFNYNLRNWTSATLPFYFGRDLASGFYCSPCFFDSVFAMTFNPYAPQLINTSDTHYIYLSKLPAGTFDSGLECPVSADICYSRDNFLTSIDFDYKKSSWLSVFSLPTL